MAGDKSPEGENERKEPAVEDLGTAPDVGAALEIYRSLMEHRRSYTNVSSLQEKVAGRMHELGDEKLSAEFTILAGQSANVEAMKQVATMMLDVEDGIQKGSYRFQESAGKVDFAATRIKESAEALGGALDRNITRFSEGAGKVGEAGNDMKNAGSTMIEAATRMQHGH